MRPADLAGAGPVRAITVAFPQVNADLIAAVGAVERATAVIHHAVRGLAVDIMSIIGVPGHGQECLWRTQRHACPATSGVVERFDVNSAEKPGDDRLPAHSAAPDLSDYSTRAADNMQALSRSRVADDGPRHAVPFLQRRPNWARPRTRTARDRTRRVASSISSSVTRPWSASTPRWIPAERQAWRRARTGDGALRCPQLTAFFTRAVIRFSSAAVIFVSAKDVGHIVPSSRFASALKPSVAYLSLNFDAAVK